LSPIIQKSCYVSGGDVSGGDVSGPVGEVSGDIEGGEAETSASLFVSVRVGEAAGRDVSSSVDAIFFLGEGLFCCG